MSYKVSSIVGLVEQFFKKVILEAVKDNTKIVSEWESFHSLLLSTPFQMSSIQAYIDRLEPKEYSNSPREQSSGDSYYLPTKVTRSCSVQSKQQQMSSQDDSSSKSSAFLIKQRDCIKENVCQYQEEDIEKKQSKQSLSINKNNDSNREGLLLFDERFDEDSEYIHFNDDDEDDSGSEKSQQKCQMQIAERKTFDGSSLPRHSLGSNTPLILQEITNKYTNNSQRQYSNYQCSSKQQLQSTTSYPSIPVAKKIQGDSKKQEIEQATIYKPQQQSKDQLVQHSTQLTSNKTRNQQVSQQQLFLHGNELNHSVNEQSSSYQQASQQSQQSSTSSPLSQQCFQTQSHSSSIAEHDNQQKSIHTTNTSYTCAAGYINFKMNNPTSTKSMNAVQEIPTNNARNTTSINQQINQIQQLQQQQRESVSVKNNQLQSIQQPSPSAQQQQQPQKQCFTSKSLKSILQETRNHTKSIEQQILQDCEEDNENQNNMKNQSSEKKKMQQQEQQKKNSCLQYQQQQLTPSSPLENNKQQQQQLLLERSNLTEQPFQMNQDSDALANLSQDSSFKQRDHHINISKPRNTVGNHMTQAAVTGGINRVPSVSTHQQTQQQLTEQLIDNEQSKQQPQQQQKPFNFPSFSTQIKAVLSLYESNSRRIQETINIHTLKYNNIHNKSQQQLQLNTIGQEQQQQQLRTQPQINNPNTQQHQGSLTPPSHGQTYFYNNPNRISYPLSNAQSNNNINRSKNASIHTTATIQQLPPSQIEQLNKNVNITQQSITVSSSAACNTIPSKSNITTPLPTQINNPTTSNNIGYYLPNSKTTSTNGINNNNNNNTSIQQLLIQSTTPAGHSNSTMNTHHQHNDSNSGRNNIQQNSQNSNQFFHQQQQPIIPIARSQRQLYIQEQQVMRQQQQQQQQYQQQQLQSLQQCTLPQTSQQNNLLPLSSSNSYLKNAQLPGNIQQTFSQNQQPYFPSKQQQQIVRQSSLPHSNNTPSTLTHFAADNQLIFQNDGQIHSQQQQLQRPIQSQQQQQYPQVRAMSALGRDRDREPSLFMNPLSFNNHNNSLNSPIHHLNLNNHNSNNSVNNHNSNPTTTSIYGNSNNQTSSVNSFKRLRTIDCTRNNYHYTNNNNNNNNNSNNINNSYSNNSNSINITSNLNHNNHNHSSSQSRINTQMLNLTVDEHVGNNPQSIMNSHNMSCQSTAPEFQSQQQRKRSEYSFPDIKTFNKNNNIRKI